MGLLLVFAAGCGPDPQTARAEHLKRAEAFVAERKYTEAIFEYKLVLQIEPTAGAVYVKLAQAFAAAGEPVQAVQAMIRAADLMPNDPEIQVKSGTGLLLLRAYAEAGSRAQAALALAPEDPGALLVLANAHAGQRNFEEALAANRRAVELAPDRVDLLVNLGALQYARGMTAEAEASYRRAAARDPNSIQAAIGLADFLSLSGRGQEAEAEYKRALQLDPASLEANRALAIFYIESGRMPDAEPRLIKVAETARTSDALYDLAELYIAANRRVEAATVLNMLRTRKSQASRATVKLASLANADGYPIQALELLDAVLEENPKDASALALKALIVLPDRDRAEALAIAEAAVLADSKSEPAQYALAVTSLARGQIENAKEAFSEVLKLNPNNLDALIELAELHREARQPDTALAYAERAARAKPRIVRAQLMLARVLSTSLEPERQARAMAIIARVTKEHPNSPEVHLQNGRVAVARKDLAGASRSFSRALELNPDSTDALVELIKVELDRGQMQSARKLIDGALAKRPDSTALLLISGKAYASIDPAVAEKHLRRVVELDPSAIDAYETLAILYFSQRRLDQARTQFEALTTEQPSSPYPPTMVGILLQVQGKKAEAETWYEKALAVSSRAATAANNLAWLWVQRNHNIEQAYQLAQTAFRELPTEPQVSDTLGFIELKKGLVASALQRFRICVGWQPNNPDFHYHLGLALVENAEFAKARSSFQKALDLNPDFRNAAETRRAISLLPY